MKTEAHDPTAPHVNPSATGPQPGDRETVTDDQSPADAFNDLRTRFAELGEYVSFYLAAKADALKVTIRNAGVLAVLGVLGLLAGSAFVITAVVLLERGIAGGLGALFGGRLWLGEIVASVLFLGLLAGAVWFGMKKLTATSRQKTVTKYESRLQQQRAKFGTDVHERGESPGK
jgi:hypothetical protein